MPSIVYRFAGPTTQITVSTTASADTSITANPGEQSNFAAFLNTGPTLTAVAIHPIDPDPVIFPTDGNPQNLFILGANMQQPEIVAVPANQFTMSAITNSSVSPVLYITPVVVQS